MKYHGKNANNKLITYFPSLNHFFIGKKFESFFGSFSSHSRSIKSMILFSYDSLKELKSNYIRKAKKYVFGPRKLLEYGSSQKK